MSKTILITFLSLFYFLISCQVQTKTAELKHFSVSDLNGIINHSEIVFEKTISSDGNGSIKIEAAKPIVINLYDVSDVRIEDAQLIYQARLKSENLTGQAYLEMWCVFKDKGEYFSRGFDSIISGTTDWKTIRTVFNLRKGEMPDRIKLNVVVNGTGTLWIDDIHLLKL
jgi:hypothetical protein